jgi:hypothetical protein
VSLLIDYLASFEKGDVTKGRKITGHVLRMLTLTPQLCHGRFEDIRAGNALYQAAMASFAASVEEITAEFQEDLDALQAALRSCRK